MIDLSDICIISANSLESENASRNRILSLVNAALEQGHEVKLISMDHDNYHLLEDANFNHYKIPFIDTKIPSFVKRAFLEMKIASLALKKAKEMNCDINLITIPSMFLLHMSAILPAHKVNVLDIRDLSWEYLDTKSLINRVAKTIFTKSALFNLKRFKIISVTNDHEFEYISKYVSDYQNMIKVPNGVSLSIFEQLSSVVENKSNNKTVTYIGNVGLAQDLSTLVEVSKQLPNVKFNIVGGGTDFERIYALADHTASNLNFLGRKNFDELIEIYNSSDILYAQLTPDFATAMPSKLYEYLSTGKYIIYGGQGVASATLSKFENVSLIQPCSVEILKQEIEKVLSEFNSSLSVLNREKIQAQYIRDVTVKYLISLF
ncbi:MULTISPECIES: glycosyltransferase [Acinetobacter]|uniref:Glycosyltransferase n=1 Tax=Acinetobacter chengduensis TaxID=2420890 RepID=A0ABX9TVL9_9GAMM|nr:MULTISPECIES: glycosyltransferase [Acinetobacter]RKG40208.1 glycosyltransferase [Acinetobacter sp. WCHAc060007]RLL21780.1 glycosyltransferase [Acinetobacter chengduensis]